MQPLNLREVLEAVDGRMLSGSNALPGDLLIHGVAIDSRNVKAGDIFFAFKGEKTDGHLFVRQAFEKGAAACVVNAELTSDKPLIQIDDSEQALMKLAKFYRQKINVPVIAITGSNGKSTTKEMTAHLLSQQFPVLKAPGSYNTEIGVPLSLLSWEPPQKAIVLEMAMRGLGQIQELCKIAAPTFGLITSIGQAHLGLLGSVQKIADAKGELLESLPHDGLAFLNGEDEWTTYLRSKSQCAARLFGFKPIHWVSAQNIKETWEGLQAELKTPFGHEKILLPFLGRHNLLNFLGATAVALSLNVPFEKIVQSTGSCVPLHGRFQAHTTNNNIKIIDDTYNANPSSLDAALQTVSALPADGRRILVLGDLLELGDFAEEAHRNIGARLKPLGFHALFGIGELSSSSVAGAAQAGLPHAQHFNNQEALGEALKSFLKSGDVVLVKGSRKMAMERITERLR